MKVTFDDGTIISYTSVKRTFVETLKKIGTDRLDEIKLEKGHRPLFTKEPYGPHSSYYVPLGDGWYVNTMSDSSEKYLELQSICSTLGVQCKVEIGADITAIEKTSKPRDFMPGQSFTFFPDGVYSLGANMTESYSKAIEKNGTSKNQI